MLFSCRYIWAQCANVHSLEKVYASLYNHFGADHAAQKPRPVNVGSGWDHDWRWGLVQPNSHPVSLAFDLQSSGPHLALASAGALVAASTDLTFNLYGYIAVGLNDFLTALYLVMVKTSPATQGLTTTGLLFYNAALSMPALALAMAVSREPWELLQFPDLHSRNFRVSRALPCRSTPMYSSRFLCGLRKRPVLRE